MSTELLGENLNRTYTLEEFLALPDDGKRYELIDGELRELPGPSIAHGLIVRNLFHHLDKFLTANPLGIVMNNLAFELNAKNAPLPDLAFVLTDRLTGKDYADAFPGPPDIAIEVVSRTDFIFKTYDKVEEYLKAGVQLVWVIDPRRKLVEIYRPGQLKPTVLDTTEELTGEGVIPGFTLPVSEIFE